MERPCKLRDADRAAGLRHVDPVLRHPPAGARRRLPRRLPLVVPAGRASRSTTCACSFVTAGYHRYFSHRAYKTEPRFQFVLAFLGARPRRRRARCGGRRITATITSIRTSRATSTRRARSGLWWSHVGWILSPQVRRDQARAHQGLRAVSRAALAQQVSPGAADAARRVMFTDRRLRRCWCGASSSRRCCCGTARSPSTRCRTCSARRAIQIDDDSKNNWLLALITGGEGWHNNHHYYQSTANQGFFWWEVDISYYALKVLSWVGVVWDLRTPPRHIRDATRAPARHARAVGLAGASACRRALLDTLPPALSIEQVAFGR